MGAVLAGLAGAFLVADFAAPAAGPAFGGGFSSAEALPAPADGGEPEARRERATRSRAANRTTTTHRRRGR